ncbi:MAG: hypothetical protein HY821_11085 [Acidobacteria bacterium]|nr:hypothetical protein [Acidobacteriota bacterium]
MPFCTQCGGQVGDHDLFCQACGSRQGTASGAGAPPSGGFRPHPASGATHGKGDFLSTMAPRQAAFFCYIPVVGWIMSIIALASERFREDKMVRFHAFQGLYLFVLWLFVDWVFGPITAYAEATRAVGKLLKLAVMGAWVFMLVKTKQGEDFHLPILGELADRSVSEQR